jgi:hypothetical protein
MTTARKVLVNPNETPLFHCIARCVRRAFLFGEESAYRKQWIEERLQRGLTNSRRHCPPLSPRDVRCTIGS